MHLDNPRRRCKEAAKIMPVATKFREIEMTMVRIILFSALSLLATASGALAQTAGDYPNQTVKIVNPFTAGSVSDILARVLADKLGALWKQTVVVENKPGIAGTISVANSAPDGYTLMSTSNGHTI